jgi:AcrR family transcriptional regulator
MPTPTRKRLPAAERRALIEQAAARLFAERGADATRLDDVAAAAGVTKPVLYRHFASKQALHLALLAKTRDELAAAALATYEPGGDPLAGLPAMLDAWFAYVEAHPHAARVLLRDPSGDPDVRAFHRELHGLQRAADMALLREAGAPIPEAQLEPLAETIRRSLTGLGLWWLDHPETSRTDLVDVMVRLIGGLVAEPPTMR